MMTTDRKKKILTIKSQMIRRATMKKKPMWLVIWDTKVKRTKSIYTTSPRKLSKIKKIQTKTTSPT